MERRTKESKRRLRSLIFLVAFSGILLIASTYAWFSAQNDVYLTNLEGKVEVVEGIEISLDGEVWTQAIDFAKIESVASTTANEDGIKAYTGNTNVQPTELKPVSSTGSVNSTDKTEMNLFYAVSDGKKLTSITDAKTAKDGSADYYYAFDVFFRNTSRETTGSDTIYLNTSTSATVLQTGHRFTGYTGVEDSGLQNTVRVGFAKFGTTTSSTSQFSTIQSTVMASTNEISEVAIWEPNANYHVKTIVDSYNKKFKVPGESPLELAYNKTLTTQALNSKTSLLTDVYDHTDTDMLDPQVTTQTTLNIDSSTGKVIVGTGQTTGYELTTSDVTAGNTKLKLTTYDETSNADAYLALARNTITKIRIYIWLEGQDVDCANYASQGGGIEVNIGLEKLSGGTTGGGTSGDSTGSTGVTTAGTYLPTGFTEVTGTTIQTGLTIKDSSGNEYVWIEVPQTAEVYPTAGLSLDLDSLEGDALTNAYTTIETDLKTYTAFYRGTTTFVDEHPADTVEANTGLTSTEYTELKQKMLKSVYQNGGFYVGKYETGIVSSYRTYGNDYTTEHPIEETAVVQANAYPYNWVRCSQAQELASGMSSGGYTSSLMFGIQWDLVLKHIEVQAVESGMELATIQGILNTDSTNYGNYANSEYTITNEDAKYGGGEYASASSYSKASGESAILTTGASETFNLFGLYDLAGNMSEWTLEYTSKSTYPCALRGGNCYDDGNFYPASDRFSSYATFSYPSNGFRSTLF